MQRVLAAIVGVQDLAMVADRPTASRIDEADVAGPSIVGLEAGGGRFGGARSPPGSPGQGFFGWHTAAAAPAAAGGTDNWAMGSAASRKKAIVADISGSP